MLRYVDIKNFKSIGASTVFLRRFNVLVGPNGAGKSNFLKALGFMSDCLESSVATALSRKGGIKAVRRRSQGHPYNIKFRICADLDTDYWADYEFEISAGPSQDYRVKNEKCKISRALLEAEFEVSEGEFIKPVRGMRPKIGSDRLALPLVSAVEEYRAIFDFITGMKFYSISPEKIREFQEPDIGKSLKWDGSNAASVLHDLKQREPKKYERVCGLLERIVPGAKSAYYASVGQMATIEFKQDVGDKAPWTFPAMSMSDGTLRVLGILLAVYQNQSPTLIGIEEPESTIHPAASDVLIDILKDGTNFSQIIITTHSPDILDHKDIKDDEIHVVESRQGNTVISPLASSSRKAIHERLYTAGDLLKMGELHPDYDAAESAKNNLPSFGEPLEFEGL